MKTRIYYAATIESMLDSLKNDYTLLMRKALDENNVEKVNRMSQAIIALDILEDRILALPVNEIEES
jgi:hypothetical protein